MQYSFELSYRSKDHALSGPTYELRTNLALCDSTLGDRFVNDKCPNCDRKLRFKFWLGTLYASNCIHAALRTKNEDLKAEDHYAAKLWERMGWKSSLFRLKRPLADILPKAKNITNVSLKLGLRSILMDHGTVLLLRIKIFTLKIGPYMMSN